MRIAENKLTATFKPYPLAEHVGTLVIGKNDVQRFIADRIAGRPATTTCS